MDKRIKYTEEHIQFLKDKVKGISLKELTSRFNSEFNMNVSESAIANQKNKYRLSSGIQGGQFRKGQAPVNKGKTWDEYMPKESQKGCRKTTFKKGHKPTNYHPIGTEMLREDGYVYVKVSGAPSPGLSRKGWRLKHQLLWEKHNGPMPKEHKIVFANGDASDIRIDNLVLVTDSELLVMNRQGLIYEDAELTKTGANIAKLIDGAHKVERRKK